ncbi:hypothetical protein [Massilia rubra]|uniref:Uncharacterized protein n=1 Tax=Massilia rubra TaxID=2607910 RepID=A0ABX0M066_9BURK|nr:hypothetical protein [Massilia rubra]NHZ37567.1 hypothetical protein [Massilia rubra]
MTLRDQLDTLNTDLYQFFDSAFDSEEDEQQANRALKSRIREVILAAHALPDPDLMREALETLSKNTGCAEDYAMFVEITDELIVKGIITASDHQDLLAAAPVNRWC